MGTKLEFPSDLDCRLQTHVACVPGSHNTRPGNHNRSRCVTMCSVLEFALQASLLPWSLYLPAAFQGKAHGHTPGVPSADTGAVTARRATGVGAQQSTHARTWRACSRNRAKPQGLRHQHKPQETREKEHTDKQRQDRAHRCAPSVPAGGSRQ